MWTRLRRLLADAQSAYAIPGSVAEQLLAEGFLPEAVGQELEPPKVVLFVPAERAALITGAREIPVRLEGALLEAPALALVRFP